MNINALQGSYIIPKGFLWLRLKDSNKFVELGDTDSFTIQVEATRDERKDNRYGVSRTSDSTVTDIAVTIAMTLMQHTNLNRSLAVGGSNGVLTQTAGTAVVKEYETMEAQQGYWLERFDVTNVVATGPADAVLVLGTDYALDAKTGFFQPLKDLVDVTITFDAAAILETAERGKFGIGGNPDIEGELIHVGNNLKGSKAFVRLWSVRLSPSGARGYIGTERAGLEIQGTAQIDTAKALLEGDVDEYAFGYETTLVG